MVKFCNSCISEWEGWLTLHKGGGSRSFMTMTIWWPRSGVWIYQIVTGVTSVVGVPSTHLVTCILWNSSLGPHCEIVLRWKPQNASDDTSTLVQVMAWCRQATSHYLIQYWPRSMSPYAVISSWCIKHRSLVLVRQKLGRTNRLSLIVYAKLQEKSV